MGHGDFQPLQNRHPLTDPQKIVTGDYVGNPYSCAKFGAHPPLRGFWANWGKHNLNFIYAPFLGHRLSDDLVDWHSGVSVRPYVHKVFPISI